LVPTHHTLRASGYFIIGGAAGFMQFRNTDDVLGEMHCWKLLPYNILEIVKTSQST